MFSQPELCYLHGKLRAMMGMFVAGYCYLLKDGVMEMEGHSCLFTGFVCIFESSSYFISISLFELAD